MFNKKTFFILIGIVMFLLVFFGTCSKEIIVQTTGNTKTYKIVVDAGHGAPDGGAVSSDGIEEAGLNLEIAEKLRDALEDEGFLVIMTREDENNIADTDKQKSLREMKSSDLTNRVNIANNSGADIMISIHMNKFEGGSSWGWQTFYSKDSDEGKRLATLVQTSIQKSIDDRVNKRVALSIEGIKIVDKTNIPVIIVECGFLSNVEDLKLLQTEEYQNKIAIGIVDGVKEFYSSL